MLGRPAKVIIASLAAGWQRAREVMVRAMEHGEMEDEVSYGSRFLSIREKRRRQGFQGRRSGPWASVIRILGTTLNTYSQVIWES